MKHKVHKSVIRAAWLFAAVALQPVSALGLSQSQRDIFDRGILYFNSSYSSDTCDLNGGIALNLPDNIPQPYNGIFSAAASAYDTNPQFLAALFLSEHANNWPDAGGPWANSKVDPAWPDGVKGARGPFQFEYGTWKGYAKDGNNDGIVDPDNIYDAAYSVANMLKMNHVSPATPLGKIETPFAPGTFLVFTASYNWGGGNVQRYTLPISPISGNDPKNPVPQETQNYLLNINSLINSGFTKSGVPTWNDPGSTTNSSVMPTIYGCSSGVVAGNVVQTAINLSWPGPHKPALDATSAYINAINESLPSARAASGGADCGAFVSVVMHASQADSNYPAIGTKAQEDYVRSHPEKYDVLDNLSSVTRDLIPGDILIVNQGSGGGAKGHTLIYIGPQPQGGNEASASLDDRMPSIGTISSLDDALGRGHYLVARIKT